MFVVWPRLGNLEELRIVRGVVIVVIFVVVVSCGFRLSD